MGSFSSKNTYTKEEVDKKIRDKDDLLRDYIHDYRKFSDLEDKVIIKTPKVNTNVDVWDSEFTKVFGPVINNGMTGTITFNKFTDSFIGPTNREMGINNKYVKKTALYLLELIIMGSSRKIKKQVEIHKCK